MTGLHGYIDTTGQTRIYAPTVCSDTRYTVALHGCISNSSALSDRLPDTHTATNDASRLLAAWRHCGSACLPELDGAFALAVWDAQERTLTLARDRFGQKPLHYALRGEGVAFSAEAADIAPQPATPDLGAIFHYLTVQSVPAPLCAFKGVRALPHAHSLVWHCGAATQPQRFWAPQFAPRFSGTLEDASDELHHLLKTSVRRHASAPAGLLLSGGVDSSLMVALLCEAGHTPPTFSVGFDAEPFDERPFARTVAQQFGTAHHELTFPADIPPLIERIVRKFASPFADSSALPTWLALHAVREAGLDRAVLGDGGDDLFAGYERHLNPFLFSGDDTEDARAAQLRTELDGRSEHAPALPAMRAASAKFYTHWARFWGPLKHEVCTDALREAADPPTSLLLARRVFQQTKAQNLLDAIQTFELDYYLPCTLTAKVEIPARSCGLTTCAPFLNNEIMAFATSLPADFRVGACKGKGSYGYGFETKRVVKQLAERFLPHGIVYRRKMGFGVPLAQWLRGPLREMLCDTLLGQSCLKRGWLVPLTVQRLLDEHIHGARDWHYPLWTLLMLELWARAFLDTPQKEKLA